MQCLSGLACLVSSRDDAETGFSGSISGIPLGHISIQPYIEILTFMVRILYKLSC